MAVRDKSGTWSLPSAVRLETRPSGHETEGAGSRKHGPRVGAHLARADARHCQSAPESRPAIGGTTRLPAANGILAAGMARATGGRQVGPLRHRRERRSPSGQASRLRARSRSATASLVPVVRFVIAAVDSDDCAFGNDHGRIIVRFGPRSDAR